MTTAETPSTDPAQRRIEHATDAIRNMSQDLANEVAPKPAWVNRVRAFTRDAPLQSLAIAFLLGVIVCRG